jgi:hypothetical protein
MTNGGRTATSRFWPETAAVKIIWAGHAVVRILDVIFISER